MQPRCLERFDKSQGPFAVVAGRAGCLLVLGTQDFARRRIHKMNSPAQIAGDGHFFGGNALNQIAGIRAAVDEGSHAVCPILRWLFFWAFT